MQFSDLSRSSYISAKRPVGSPDAAGACVFIEVFCVNQNVVV